MSFITFFNMLSMLVILPMYMQMALLITAFTTGLILLPGSLLNCVLAPSIGRLFDKSGPKAVITPGTILVIIGYAAYSQFGPDTALWMIVLTHIIMMLGIGAVLASVQDKYLEFPPETALSRRNRFNSNNPTSSWGYWYCGNGITFIRKTK